jgi:ApaG protein
MDGQHDSRGFGASAVVDGLEDFYYKFHGCEVIVVKHNFVFSGALDALLHHGLFIPPGGGVLLFVGHLASGERGSIHSVRAEIQAVNTCLLQVVPEAVTGRTGYRTCMSAGSDMVTNGVRVCVSPEFLSEQSDPTAGVWLHAYHVVIENMGEQPVQLLSRHWVITNARGEVEHVRGPGVVGHQPRLHGGETFQYTSGCPLDTSMGTMHGTFRMVREDGVTFDAEIAPFTLSEPFGLN